MRPPRYVPDTLAIARAALARGPLVQDCKHWRFGRRLFNPATVGRLIAAGEAERIGNRVVAAEPGP